MKKILLVFFLCVLSSCATHRLTNIEEGRHVLVPTVKDFKIKTGARYQIGADEYLIVGEMDVDNKTYSVIQLPHDVGGFIFYSLISKNGELYPETLVAVDGGVEPEEADFTFPQVSIRVIPDNVRFFPK